MKTTDFYFDLPESLIAQFPAEHRGQSRLLVLNRQTGALTHSSVADLKSFIPDHTLLVFNNSKVRRARVFALSPFGGRVELIFLRPAAGDISAPAGSSPAAGGTPTPAGLSPAGGAASTLSGTSAPADPLPAAGGGTPTPADPFSAGGTPTPAGPFPAGVGTPMPADPLPAGDGASLWEVLPSKAKRQTEGKLLTLPDGTRAQITAKGEDGTTRWLKTERPLTEAWFNTYGHVPLPPYIKRSDCETDFERYQTLYSSQIGSCAAPTAGLHFTRELLQSLHDPERDLDTVEVTLHVGLGTFLPVRTETVQDHSMHTERYFISEAAAGKINQAIREGKNILAVGTTSVRTLESAADSGGWVRPGYGETDIFIYPGYRFKVVRRIFTNFHTPESTLLMLVSAFAGRETVLSAYQTAVRMGYRFFSYGDAMLIL